MKTIYENTLRITGSIIASGALLAGVLNLPTEFDAIYWKDLNNDGVIDAITVRDESRVHGIRMDQMDMNHEERQTKTNKLYFVDGNDIKYTKKTNLPVSKGLKARGILGAYIEPCPIEWMSITEKDVDGNDTIDFIVNVLNQPRDTLYNVSKNWMKD